MTNETITFTKEEASMMFELTLKKISTLQILIDKFPKITTTKIQQEVWKYRAIRDRLYNFIHGIQTS